MTGTTSFRGFTLHYSNKESMEGMCYEADAFASHVELPTGDVTVVECGANIGVFVLLWKNLCPDAKVICFEPDPVAFSLLEKNVVSNRLSDVQCVNAAVSDTEGQAELFGDLNGDGDSRGNSILAAWGKRESTTSCPVKTVRLSNYIKDRSTSFLKLDVEGCEERVLRDIAPLLPTVDVMYVEVHETVNTTTDNSLSRIQQLIIEAGFSVEVEHRAGEYALPPRFSAWQAANDAQQTQLFCKRISNETRTP